MVGATGFEPVHSNSQKLNNTRTKIPQNSAESNTRGGEATAPDDKTPTTPEQEKDTFLHSKCAISVHQNYLPLSAELELVIKAWPDLSNEIKEKILAMITKKEEGK